MNNEEIRIEEIRRRNELAQAAIDAWRKKNSKARSYRLK